MIKKKNPPYSGTKKDPDSTIADINRLLREYGIQNYQWTTLYDKQKVELKFVIEVSAGRNVMMKVIPPAFLQQRRTWDEKLGRNVVLNLPNWAVSLRLMWWWLKVKLEAVAYGLREVEEEFLSDIVTVLPSGEETTIGAIIRPRLTGGTDGIQKVTALPNKAEDADEKA